MGEYESGSIVLTDLAAQYPDVRTAICNLAEYLDTHGAPIDYRRRRAVFTTVELTSSDWRSLCMDADTNPGHDARRLHARRHLFALLTGANLADRRHPLAVTTANDRDQYQWFDLRMPTALRDVLHRHPSSSSPRRTSTSQSRGAHRHPASPASPCPAANRTTSTPPPLPT